MPRFWRQRHTSDCAVIALANALIFQGKKLVYERDYKRLAKKSKYKFNGHGVPNRVAHRTYRKHGFTRINQASWYKIEQVLWAGDAVIAAIARTETKRLPDGSSHISVQGHAFTITAIAISGGRRWYYCTNFSGHWWLTINDIYRVSGKLHGEEVWFQAAFRVPGPPCLMDFTGESIKPAKKKKP